MIKTTELRYGNYFEHMGQVCECVSITDDTVMYKNMTGIHGGYSEIFDSEIEGIKLTDELLIQFQFDKIEEPQTRSITYKKAYMFTWDKKPFVSFRIIDFSFAATGERFRGYLVPLVGEDEEFFMSARNVHIEYVHQLQNLYFAITGKELKFLY